jgi:hypothetical protein
MTRHDARACTALVAMTAAQLAAWTLLYLLIYLLG